MSAADWPGVLAELERWIAEQSVHLGSDRTDAVGDEAPPSPAPALGSAPGSAPGPLPREHAERARRVLDELRRLEIALTSARNSTARELQLHSRLGSAHAPTSAVFVDGYG